MKSDARHRNQRNLAHGVSYYELYLKTQDRLHGLDKAEELAKSAKMFDAWQRQTAQHPDTSNRSTGIAVVRTLAKETKKQHQNAAAKTNERQALESERDELLQKAAQIERNPLAWLQLGDNRLQENTMTEAMEYYRQAGKLGSGEAWFRLGQCLWEVDDNEPNTEEALDCFRIAADMGDLDAMYCLGVHTLGSAQDGETARAEQLQSGLAYMERAAAAHHGEAMQYLVLLHKNGFPPLGIRPCTDREFVERLDAACETSEEALFLRGSCRYASGDAENNGYEQNVQNALEDFLRATDMGHADAAVSAGAILHRGVPGIIAQDQQRAFQLYQQAGELGNMEGWRNVVACYATGEGVPQSMSMAKYIAELMLRRDEDDDAAQ